MPSLQLSVTTGDQVVQAQGNSNDYFSAVSTSTSFLEVHWSVGSTNGTYGAAGVRFPSVSIPKNATVDTADFKMFVNSSQGGGLNHAVWAKASDDAPAFAGGANCPRRTGKTTAQTVIDLAADITNTGSGTGWLTGVGITSVVQEIVDRTGWSTSNAMRFTVMQSNAALTSSGNYTSGSFKGFGTGVAGSEPYIDITYTEYTPPTPTKTGVTATTGKNEIAEIIGGLGTSSGFTYLHVGGGSTAATAADTQLQSEFTDSGLAAAAGTITTASANVLDVTHLFTVTATKVIKEFGLFDDNDVLGVRTVTPEIEVNSGDTISIKQQLTIN